VKIARVRWAHYSIPFRSPYETARGSATQREGFIVALQTDDGVEGYGEAALDPAAPADQTQALQPHIEALAAHLLSTDLADIDAFLEPRALGGDAERAAHCAIETALLDAGARTTGHSLAELLAEYFHIEASVTLPELPGAVPVNATIAARATAAAAAEALAAAATGYGCVKLKVGMEASVEAEVARVQAVRQVIGPDVRLRLDANGAWDEARAIETIQTCEPYDIELIEQPVPASEFASLGRVRDAVVTSVAADEAAFDYASAERAVRYADLLVLKPMRLGGLSVSRYIAQAALATGRDVIVTTTIDSGIGTAMALQLAASLPSTGRAHGLATAGLLEHDLLVEPLSVKRGVMALPETPGLGVELDEAALARYSDGWREATP
jgi:o-succinylbenzoate synthase